MKLKDLFKKQSLPFRISVQLSELRMELGLTQEDLAKKVGISQSTIARLENPEHYPSLKTLERIAKAVNKNLIIYFETK